MHVSERMIKAATLAEHPSTGDMEALAAMRALNAMCDRQGTTLSGLLNAALELATQVAEYSKLLRNANKKLVEQRAEILKLKAELSAKPQLICDYRESHDCQWNAIHEELWEAQEKAKAAQELLDHVAYMRETFKSAMKAFEAALFDPAGDDPDLKEYELRWTSDAEEGIPHTYENHLTQKQRARGYLHRAKAKQAQQPQAKAKQAHKPARKAADAPKPSPPMIRSVEDVVAFLRSNGPSSTEPIRLALAPGVSWDALRQTMHQQRRSGRLFKWYRSKVGVWTVIA